MMILEGEEICMIEKVEMMIKVEERREMVIMMIDVVEHLVEVNLVKVMRR